MITEFVILLVIVAFVNTWRVDRLWRDMKVVDLEFASVERLYSAMKGQVEMLEYIVLSRSKSRVEELAEQIHKVYQKEAKRQGDVRHEDDYADLPENIKDYDRAIARFILGEEE